MIDAEAYLYELFTRDIEDAGFDEDVTVAADIDVQVMDELPYWTFSVIGDGQQSNGDDLWSYTLTVSVFAEGMDATKNSARAMYDLVHAWDTDPGATQLTTGGDTIWVSSLDDIDLPSRLASAEIAGRNITQYTGSFGLALRNN